MRKIMILFLIVILLIGCSKEDKIEQTTKITNETIKPIEIYFCPRDDCQAHFIIELNKSKEKIRCAVFDLDLIHIIDLLEEKQQDIDVNLVVDNNNENDEIKKINNLKMDSKYGLMHNKFCVVDNETVLTGSFNPTLNDNYLNNNNLLVIHSKLLSQNYENEFNELWNEQFGRGRQNENSIFYLSNKKIENYFCPDDSCTRRVMSELNEAKKSVYFMAFSFTEEEIGDFLLDNKDKLEIKGIFETTQISNYSEYDKLKEFSKKDNNKYKLHHKVFIIDNQTVITGSYNPSQNADQKNDENILIIHDKSIAEKYLEEFDYVWNYEEKLITEPKKAESLLLSEVYYDTSGTDAEEEYIIIYNPANKSVNLERWSLSNNKTNFFFKSFVFQPDHSLVVRREHFKFALNNGHGFVILKDPLGNQADFVSWNSIWQLNAENGEVLRRISYEKSNDEDSWVAENIG